MAGASAEVLEVLDGLEGGYDSDPEEAVIDLRRGQHARPYHPRETNTFKLTLLGARGVGKTSVATRLVTHSFDANCRPTVRPESFYASLTDPERPQDLLVELEDLPGVEIAEVDGSGRRAPLTAAAESSLRRLLHPLFWFEQRRKQSEMLKTKEKLMGEGAEEYEPLLGKKRAARRGLFAELKKRLVQVRSGRSTRFKAHNPIASARKRMGFIVVADVSSAQSFQAAYAIVEQIFNRLQFDVSDDIYCPAAVILLGNKADLRGARRDPSLGTPAEMKEQVERRFENVERSLRSVSYLECSASSSAGIEEILPAALGALRSRVPSRTMIRASRLRDRGRLGQLKRRLYTAAPLLFEVEDVFRSGWRRSASIRRRLDVPSFVWHQLLGPNGIPFLIYRRTKRALSRDDTCGWCPEWVRRRATRWGGGGGQKAKPEEPDDDLDLNLAEGSVAANVARRVREGNLIGDDLEVAAGAARGTTTCQYGPIHGI